jgi:hypothetical protein
MTIGAGDRIGPYEIVGRIGKSDAPSPFIVVSNWQSVLNSR